MILARAGFLVCVRACVAERVCGKSVRRLFRQRHLRRPKNARTYRPAGTCTSLRRRLWRGARRRQAAIQHRSVVPCACVWAHRCKTVTWQRRADSHRLGGPAPNPLRHSGRFWQVAPSVQAPWWPPTASAQDHLMQQLQTRTALVFQSPCCLPLLSGRCTWPHSTQSGRANALWRWPACTRQRSRPGKASFDWARARRASRDRNSPGRGPRGLATPSPG